ncbi:MerR family transcriptional regulator [Vallitalea pronyensis]|uniref:MerR family transcriptional regulator n=1 Tax=Vallitalea pronyensis TaxID=1348613 RepID=A0A8J8MJF5_9FIRM|nr:MerR family transcriptional regulator [Vallitalea pronyensis]QUI22561.1 MerR family transcriptional regulator [Vallitalea pronyensis]
MDLIKITELSKKLNISSRSLRYYEQVGLIKSIRPDHERYRYFDKQTVERLKQILILRKMQIPIKHIIHIYESDDMRTVVKVFMHKLDEIDNDVNALYKLRKIVNRFLETMHENGIDKISALPLLYEKMEKQLDRLEENIHQPITYKEIDLLSKELQKNIDIRIVELPKMRVLSSYLKDTHLTESNPDSFWTWINEHELPLGKVGNHAMFDFQSMSNPEEYQTVTMIALSNEFHNDSPYEDYLFEGGLFAVASTFVYDGLSACHDQIIEHFHHNKFYQVDYQHDGTFRHPSLIETVLSPDGKNDKVDIFVPIKKRVADDSLFDQVIMIDAITVDQVEKSSPILKSYNINLEDITPILNPSYTINEDGEAEYIAYIDKRVLSTNIKLPIPFRVDITFRVDTASLRLYHGKAAIGVNDGHIFDMGGNTKDLYVYTPVFGTEEIYSDKININRNGYNTLTWIVGEQYFTVILNGEIVHCGTNYPYMQTVNKKFEPHPVIIGSSSYDKVIIRSVRVSKVKQKKKNIIKEGELIMAARQSNNTLPNIYNLVTWHYGQNYVLNGCMAYLMACLGEKDYDYWFFSGVTGDNLTQVYGFKYADMHTCLSKVLFSEPYIQKIFDTCGYEQTYVTEKQLNANKEMFLQTAMAYIDKGIPIIARISNEPGYARIICGYEEFGKTLLYLDGDDKEAKKQKVEGDIKEDWIFVGSKKENIELAQIYRKAIMGIPNLITMPKTNNCTFGAQAFRDWAMDIEHGRFDGVTEDAFDQWRDHTVYVCNYATNCCCYEFLNRAIAHNPDMTFIKDIQDIYDNQKLVIMEKMKKVGGDFNVTLPTLKDREKRKKIAMVLREFAASYDDILAIFNQINT